MIAPVEKFDNLTAMNFWFRHSLLAALLLLAAGGCSGPDQVSTDEEKEPHFVLGNSKFNSLDYPGAIEAFQEALEVNPRSAQAHYRLAQLFDTKQPDPAAAVYHYNEYLRLDAQAENVEVIRQRIAACKQQLAADVLAMPTAPAALRQVEILTETNRALQARIEQLNTQLRQWTDYATSLQASLARGGGNNGAGGGTPDDVTGASGSGSAASGGSGTAPPRGRPVPPAMPVRRTHVVVAGETLASIARKHGVSLSALQAANPGVTPKRLRTGQTLYLP